MAKYMKFTVGDNSVGYKTVEIFIGGGEVVYSILRCGLLGIDKRKSPAAKVDAKWLKELDALEIFSWKKDYIDAEISDETKWELLFKDGKKIYRGQGVNAYPENWTQFLDWLDALIPNLEFVNRKRLEKITLNYLEERLVLDRTAKTLTLNKKNSSHIYNIGEDIKKIFDACQNFFDGIETGDADINFGSRINIELIRHDGSSETFETLFNENFLPGLNDFIAEIHACAEDLTAEIFAPETIKFASRQGKYILCKVQFQDSYKHYTYRTDDETFSIGDVVDVPVGRYNDVNQARIVEIGYFDEYEAPFPIDKIKKIIGKHVAADW